MEVGWFFPAQVEQSVPDLNKLDWEREKDTALFCEEAGFEGIYVPDHLMLGAGVSYESFSVLAALAEATSSVKLGCLVSCVPFRNPALIAKIGGTIDRISGGRLRLGLGAGWHEQEFRSYGYEFEDSRQRVDRLEEAADLIGRLWKESEVNFEGNYYRVDNCICHPKPDDPYLIVGGKGPRVESIATSYADEWNFLGGHSEIVERSPKEKDISVSWFGGAVVSRKQSHIDDITSRGYAERPERYVAGSPEKVVRKLRDMEKRGIDKVILRIMDYPDTVTLNLLADEIIPQVKNE